MRKLGFLALLIAGLLGSGCSRALVETKIAADGSFYRTVKYSTTAFDMSALAGNQSGGEALTGAENRFRIPAPGPNVTIAKATDKDGTKTVAVTRSAPGGSEPLTDVVLLDKNKKPEMSSTVSVSKRPDGEIEYVEKLHWTGPPQPQNDSSLDQMKSFIQKALPARDQNAAAVSRVSNRLATSVIYLLFGPPEPTLGLYMLDPDLVQYKLGDVMQTAMGDTLQKELPDLTPEEKKHFFAALASGGLLQSNMPATKASGAQDQGDISPLTFAVQFPGKIVKTNGQVDSGTGQVYWSLLEPVVTYGDVTLDLVVDPKSQAAVAGAESEPLGRGIGFGVLLGSVLVALLAGAGVGAMFSARARAR